MTRVSKVSIWLLFALLLRVPVSKAQTTINAASCSSTAVQAALNSVKTDGTVVNVPAGTCTWTTQVVYNQVFSTTILGAGSQVITGGGDITVINDGVTGDNPSLLINTASGKSFRLSAMTFQNNTYAPKYEGTLRVVGGSTSVRLDHLHFFHISKTSIRVTGVYGVMDHSLVDMQAPNDNGIKIGSSGNGDATWAAPTAFGTNQFFYVEDSTFNNGVANDCDHGGKNVFRHNNFSGQPATGAIGGLQTHPTGGGGADLRGCRAWEIYQNTFAALPSGNAFNALFASSGTGLMWGNVVPPSYTHVLTIHSMRRNNNTYSETAPPNGWGYCGTSLNGAGSAWDQNSNTSSGYACLDQPGRGQGDLITGSMPNAVNSRTGTVAWTNEALEPIYEWMTTGWLGAAGSYEVTYDGPSLLQNQDYYLWCDSSSVNGCTSFNGTQGTGSGLLSARPSSCTAGPGGNTPGVAYWATDQGTLYVCNPTNTWTAYYTPYTYPHPLTAGSGTPPAPPTGLAAIVN